jgi:hypothetical protein
MRLAQPIETKQWSWLRGLAMHRIRLTFLSDTDCQSNVASPCSAASYSARRIRASCVGYLAYSVERCRIQSTVTPPQHRLYFLPEPHGQGSFRLNLGEVPLLSW